MDRKFTFVIITLWCYRDYESAYNTVRPRKKRKLINQVTFSENCNDLSGIVYIVTKFNLSSFFWHQLQDVLAMHGQARTISNGDVKIDFGRIGI